MYIDLVTHILRQQQEAKEALNFIERNGIFGLFVVLLIVGVVLVCWFMKKMIFVLEKFLSSLLKSQEDTNTKLDRQNELMEDQGKGLEQIRRVGEETNTHIRLILSKKGVV